MSWVLGSWGSVSGMGWSELSEGPHCTAMQAYAPPCRTGAGQV